MTNYNPSWEKLKRSLYSALFQRNIDIEIIVTDDGSEKNYFPEIENLFAEFGFDKYVLFGSEKNNGTCFNYYRAVVNARGKYVKGISPGDYFYDDALAKFYDYAESCSAEICFGNAIYYSDDDNGFRTYKIQTQPHILKFYSDAYVNLKAKRKAIILDYSVLNDFVCGASYFSKTEVITRFLTRILGKVKYAEDNCFRLMVLSGIDIHYYDMDIVWYEYGIGISTQKSKKWSAMLEKDVQVTNQIMFQCGGMFEWFPIRYRFLLRLGQRKIFSYILFPKTLYFKYYKMTHPSYTKQTKKTNFYKRILISSSKTLG